MAKSKKPSKAAKPKKPKAVAKKPAKSKAKPAASKAKPSANGKGNGTKSGKSTKSAAKKPSKPKKPKTLQVALLSVAGAVATPTITKPAANSNVAAGVDYKVEMTTDQVGFRYILTLTDVTVPPPPPPPPAPPPPPIVIPVPVDFKIAAPGASPFYYTIPGAKFVSGHSYRLRLWVDPLDGMTPPNNDATNPFNCP